MPNKLPLTRAERWEPRNIADDKFFSETTPPLSLIDAFRGMAPEIAKASALSLAGRKGQERGMRRQFSENARLAASRASLGAALA